MARSRYRGRQRGFNAVIENDYKVDSDYSYGTVAYTSPGSGSSASSGDTVVIYVSDGTPYVPPAPDPQPAPQPQPQPQPPAPVPAATQPAKPKPGMILDSPNSGRIVDAPTTPAPNQPRLAPQTS